MAGKNELEIEISNDGEVTIHVQGVKGKKCMDLTRELEESLGVVTAREMKSSFYEQEEAARTRVSEEGK